MWKLIFIYLSKSAISNCRWKLAWFLKIYIYCVYNVLDEWRGDLVDLKQVGLKPITQSIATKSNCSSIFHLWLRLCCRSGKANTYANSLQTKSPLRDCLWKGETPAGNLMSEAGLSFSFWFLKFIISKEMYASLTDSILVSHFFTVLIKRKIDKSTIDLISVLQHDFFCRCISAFCCNQNTLLLRKIIEVLPLTLSQMMKSETRPSAEK